jgi:hypothetical protein
MNEIHTRPQDLLETDLVLFYSIQEVEDYASNNNNNNSHLYRKACKRAFRDCNIAALQ